VTAQIAFDTLSPCVLAPYLGYTIVMRGIHKPGCCFPTGEHYAGLADRIAETVQRVEGLVEEFEPSARWSDIPMVLIDFETTGRDSREDRVIELGLVHIDRGEITAKKSMLVNPGVPVPEDSTAIHGLKDSDLVDKPSFSEVLPEVIPLLDGRLPAAYNANFDRGFLLEEFARSQGVSTGAESIPPALRQSVRWIDPLVWARELLSDLKSRRLGAVCEHLDIDIGQAHRAADDAAATARVLFALAPQMPETYGELIRIQDRYSARQEAEFAAWRNRRS